MSEEISFDGLWNYTINERKLKELIKKENPQMTLQQRKKDYELTKNIIISGVVFYEKLKYYQENYIDIITKYIYGEKWNLSIILMDCAKDTMKNCVSDIQKWEKQLNNSKFVGRYFKAYVRDHPWWSYQKYFWDDCLHYIAYKPQIENINLYKIEQWVATLLYNKIIKKVE